MFTHDFPFDPTYGYTLDSLLQLRLEEPEPSDLEAFWQTAYQETLALDPSPTVESEISIPSGYRIQILHYRTLENTTVGAWLCTPEDTGSITRCLLVGHGYGGREAPDTSHLDRNTAVLFPCAPGFHLSIDSRFPENNASLHVIHGIEDPRTYLIRLCAAAFWSSVSVLCGLFPAPSQKLLYLGYSFGGGMGSLFCPWDNRIKAAVLGEPTFGNHPFRLHHQCNGSGESVRQLFLKQPGISSTLRYFDAAATIRRLQIPVLFNCSIFDPSVPPPGQFTIHNECTSLSKELITHRVGHCSTINYPEQIQELRHQITSHQKLWDRL